MSRPLIVLMLAIVGPPVAVGLVVAIASALERGPDPGDLVLASADVTISDEGVFPEIPGGPTFANRIDRTYVRYDIVLANTGGHDFGGTTSRQGVAVGLEPGAALLTIAGEEPWRYRRPDTDPEHRKEVGPLMGRSLLIPVTERISPWIPAGGEGEFMVQFAIPRDHPDHDTAVAAFEQHGRDVTVIVFVGDQELARFPLD